MRLLFDSNAVRAYAEQTPTLVRNLARASNPELAIPVVVLVEQWRGRQDALVKATPDRVLVEQRKFIETKTLLKKFSFVYFDQQAVQTLTNLQSRFRTKKRYVDVMIAALAMSSRCVLVTRNTKDFADLLPAAQLQNWIDHVY
ncbi:MAG: type II toxin-antitoxin system VapC family toxin [Acidobacteria bacterium]|nr:type II toxin-antitoxin system VapC family toxin [Acidobacteriota bacterium]